MTASQALRRPRAILSYLKGLGVKLSTPSSPSSSSHTTSLPPQKSAVTVPPKASERP